MQLKNKRVFVSIISMLCSTPAFANHGLDALGKAIEILLIIALVILGITVIAFIIAARNIPRKNKRMRVLSVILSLPMLLLTFITFTIHPLPGLIAGAILVILWILIYKSYEPNKEHLTPGDME